MMCGLMMLQDEPVFRTTIDIIINCLGGCASKHEPTATLHYTLSLGSRTAFWRQMSRKTFIWWALLDKEQWQHQKWERMNRARVWIAWFLTFVWMVPISTTPPSTTQLRGKEWFPARWMIKSKHACYTNISWAHKVCRNVSLLIH